VTETHQFATLERVLSRLMLAGVLTSAACLLAGLAVFLLGGSAGLTTLILTVGLFVLMGTPVMRVAVSVLESIRMRDWFFVTTTLAVMVLLGLTMAHALRWF
jgi:uncharacterized membrane protein